MIVVEYEDYGIIPILVGAGLATVIGGGAYYLGRKSAEGRYYDCLTEYLKKGVSIEQARKACGTPFRKPSLIQQLITLPIVAIGAYFIYTKLKKE